MASDPNLLFFESGGPKPSNNNYIKFEEYKINSHRRVSKSRIQAAELIPQRKELANQHEIKLVITGTIKFGRSSEISLTDSTQNHLQLYHRTGHLRRSSSGEGSWAAEIVLRVKIHLRGF
jgi:hypothetical protein